MKQRKKSFGMRISAFVLSFAMVCTMLAGVNVVAFAAEGDDELTDTVSVLRAYNPNNGEHLMTIDEAEYNANVARGYSGEGEAWVAPLYSETEVWRAYNPNSGEHMLAPQAEVVALSQAGWQNEGLKMYSDDNMGVPIYRVFNPNATDAGSHHYCGEEEAAALVELGWQWDNNGEPVIYGVAEEPPVILVKLTDANQLSANSVEVTFDQSATGLVDKDDITVYAADGTLVLPANSIEMSADGMSAVLSLAVPFADGKEYVVSLNDSEVELEASVGQVASIVVATASAKQNESTPIEYALYDENGVDVTSTVKLSKTIQIDVEGDDVVPDVTNPNKPSLTMGTVGETATVTITYNSNEVDAEDVVGVGEITCVEAEALVGTGIYYDIDENDETTAALYTNANSGCVKFYWGLIQTSPVKVEYGKTNQEIYWCAGDLASMTVYDYDEYKVESSDDDVMSVESVGTDDGKFVRLKVTGNETGTANVVITATKNEKDTVYTIPVTVTDEAELKSITLTVDKGTISNAYDLEYYGVATVKATDSNGNTMKPGDYTVTFENDAENEGKGAWATDFDETNDAALEGTMTAAANAAGYTDGATFGVTPVTGLANGKVLSTLAAEQGLKSNQAIYSAFGAKKSTNKINATVSAGDVVKEKSVAVTVKEIDKEAWDIQASAAGVGADVSYKIETSGTSINEFTTTYVKSRLAAYYKNLFVGYVRQGAGGFGTIGSPYAAQAAGTSELGTVTGAAVKVKYDKQISDLKLGVKYGSKYADVNAGGLLGQVDLVKLFDNANNIQTDKDALTPINSGLALTAITGVDLNPATQHEIAIGESNYDKTFAKPGSYTLYYMYALPGNDDVSLNSKLTLTNAIENNGMYPKVTVTSRNVESISVSDIIGNLTTLVDMNNNNGSNESIDQAIYGNYNKTAGTFAAVDTTKTKATVKYVTVNETFGNWPTALTGGNIVPLEIKFYVPINTTFYEE